MVSLLDAIVVYYGWGVDDQLWGSGRGAFAGCHCSLLQFGGRVTTNFGGVDGGRCWVPMQGAIVVWLAGAFFLYIDNTKIVFCYLGSMLA